MTTIPEYAQGGIVSGDMLAPASDINDIFSLPTRALSSCDIDKMIAGLNRPAPDDMRQAINRLIQNIQSQCAEEGKLEIKLDGIYLNGVNCTDWMRYAADGGKLSLFEYVKQHTTTPIEHL